MNFTKPNFYPRGQTIGTHRWACVYCAYVNTHSLTPTAFKMKCGRCGHIVWYGSVYHIPAGTHTRRVKDDTIPTWAGEEYSYDPINFDPMPVQILAPEPIKQRGRLHMVLIHDNFYWIPKSLEESVQKSPSTSDI